MDSVTCTLSNQVLVRDGAVPISRDQAIKGQPSSGHYIAALSRASFDSQIRYDALNKYHYMRKDADGTWSNKFPWSAPFNTDMEGKPIIDPQAALLAGCYFVCGYYHVQPEKVSHIVMPPMSLKVAQCCIAHTQRCYSYIHSSVHVRRH
jgi:hypothetical protein